MDLWDILDQNTGKIINLNVLCEAESACKMRAHMSEISENDVRTNYIS